MLKITWSAMARTVVKIFSDQNQNKNKSGEYFYTFVPIYGPKFGIAFTEWPVKWPSDETLKLQNSLSGAPFATPFLIK